MCRARRVIVIDDSAEDIVFARRAVASLALDLDVVVVDRPPAIEAALRDLEAGAPRPELVLLDLKMPALDGHEVLARIRASCTPGEVPVVIFSSSLEPSDLVRAYRLGANSYVRKPVVFEAYRDAVRETVSYWVTHNRRIPEDAA